MLDTKALATATAVIVKEATAPLAARIAELEKRMPEKGERGDVGEPGQPGVGIAAAEKIGGVLILRLTDGQAIEVGQVDGKDGEPGPMPDAETVVDALRGVVADTVNAAVAQLPTPEKGEKGDTGEPGPMPDPGAVAAELRGMAENIVAEAVAAGLAGLPPPEKGEKGDQGLSGAAGADGRGWAKSFVDRDGNLIATFTDGSTESLGQVIGKDGAPGRDGADGFGFDDLTFEHDGERGFKLLFVKGERTKEFAFEVPVVLDRGVWKEREEGYRKGDAVSWAGSLWIAQSDTKAKPDTGDGWRLSVKRGRDGKDAGKANG